MGAKSCWAASFSRYCGPIGCIVLIDEIGLHQLGADLVVDIEVAQIRDGCLAPLGLLLHLPIDILKPAREAGMSRSTLVSRRAASWSRTA